MLHSGFISAQWEPDIIGVQVLRQPENVMVAMHHIGVGHHQSFFFRKEHYEEILCFFRLLGFPCENSNPFKL